MEYIEKYNVEDYFSFTFCRNPFDRLVSDFKFQGRIQWNFHRLYRKYKFNFKNFVKYLVASDLKFSVHRHSSQASFYKGLPREMDKTWDMLQFLDRQVDFIGRFETLQEDFNTICDKIGIPRQELPHKNATKHKHYTEYYDDETRQIVAEKYAKDIEYFGYEFGK